MAASSWYSRMAKTTARMTGRPATFALMALLVVVWGLCGPVFHYSDTWQLTINTGTTIVTFLMVFLIQNTQNRDAKAIHLKLDELLRAVDGARTGLVDLENLSDEELDKLHLAFQKLREKNEGAVEECVQELQEELEDELEDEISEREAWKNREPLRRGWG